MNKSTFLYQIPCSITLTLNYNRYDVLTCNSNETPRNTRQYNGLSLTHSSIIVMSYVCFSVRVCAHGTVSPVGIERRGMKFSLTKFVEPWFRYLFWGDSQLCNNMSYLYIVKDLLSLIMCWYMFQYTWDNIYCKIDYIGIF